MNFWQIIDQTRPGAGPRTPSASPDALLKVLSALPTEDVREFMREFARYQIELNQWDLWGAGYALAGGMGDDGFHYFRSWIIGKGLACFDQALRDPSGLLPYLDTKDPDNELLEYVALDVLKSRGIADDPRDDLDAYADDEPEGEPFDEEAVDEIYPQLAKFARS